MANAWLWVGEARERGKCARYGCPELFCKKGFPKTFVKFTANFGCRWLPPDLAPTTSTIRKHLFF